MSSSSSSSSSSDDDDSSSEDSFLTMVEDEEEDLLLFPLLNHIPTGKRKINVMNYMATIDSWSEAEYKSHLRINWRTVIKLTATLFINKIFVAF